jgi:hypothetical protein
VSIGGIQSNQTRQVAAVAAHLGMKCVLVQENWVNYSDAVYDRVGNIEMSRIMGADVRLDAAGFDIGIRPSWEQAMDDVKKAGGKPFPIPQAALSTLRRPGLCGLCRGSAPAGKGTGLSVRLHRRVWPSRSGWRPSCAGTRWPWWCAPTRPMASWAGTSPATPVAADLFEVGFNHFFRAREGLGDASTGATWCSSSRTARPACMRAPFSKGA